MGVARDSELRILLVEDNEAILRALASLLRLFGHSVTEARSVCEALSLFQRQTVDLLISDINIGHGSGLELIRRIRQSSETPAIAISGQSDMSETSLASGFSAFLHKPISNLCLQQTIRLVAPGGSIPELGSVALGSVSRRRG